MNTSSDPLSLGTGDLTAAPRVHADVIQGNEAQPVLVSGSPPHLNSLERHLFFHTHLCSVFAPSGVTSQVIRWNSSDGTSTGGIESALAQALSIAHMTAHSGGLSAGPSFERKAK